MIMRQLTVLRHAKAEDPSLTMQDFQRPLAERGNKDARAAARVLAALPTPVDWWISSPAVRARATAEAVAAELGYTKTIQFADEGYPGTPDGWLALLAAVPPEAQHVAIVGHNPSLEGLITGLTTGDCQHLNFRLPTAGVAYLELEIAHWDQVRWGCGQLRVLAPPKVVRK
jgi:phosphohistidine phosphatase